MISQENYLKWFLAVLFYAPDYLVLCLCLYVFKAHSLWFSELAIIILKRTFLINERASLPNKLKQANIIRYYLNLCFSHVPLSRFLFLFLE